MSVRDESLNWKEESVLISNEIKSALEPILKRCIDLGMTYEDFFYLVSTESNEMIMLQVLDRDKNYADIV